MDSAAQQKRNREKRKARAAMERSAAEGRTISYSDALAAMESGAMPNSQYLTDIFWEISLTSLKEKEVLLSAVVVNAGGAHKGIPSPGFFEFAESRGLEVPDERAFWKQAVERVSLPIDSLPATDGPCPYELERQASLCPRDPVPTCTRWIPGWSPGLSLNVQGRSGSRTWNPKTLVEGTRGTSCGTGNSFPGPSRTLWRLAQR